MSKVKFYRDLEANVPNGIAHAGKVYYTDQHNIYVIDAAGNKVKFSDVVFAANEADVTAISAKLQQKIYVAIAEGTLWHWNGANMLQLGGTGSGGTGSKWYTDAGAPAAGLGINGDFYLDSTNGDFFEKVNGSWKPEGNLKGPQGNQGLTGPTGNTGANGTDGHSAYQIWLDLGNVGTEQDFINSLEGPQGPAGTDGADGADGAGISWQGAWSAQVYAAFDGVEYNGSSYIANAATVAGDVPGSSAKWDLWVEKGNQGNVGPAGNDGTNGLSAYQVWLNLGNSGTEQDFINSLEGPQGPAGTDGADGADGAGISWQGAWSAQVYAAFDGVEYNGSSYIANAATVAGDVPGSSAKWDLWVEGGEVNTIESVTSGEPTGSDQVVNVVSLTQAEYDAGVPVATTFYIITA